MDAVMELYDRIIDEKLLVRRVTIAACHLAEESQAQQEEEYEQLDLFTDYTQAQEEREEQAREDEKERQLQHAVLDIKKKYGKNAILKGMNFVEGATTIERNGQIGGHKA